MFKKAHEFKKQEKTSHISLSLKRWEKINKDNIKKEAFNENQEKFKEFSLSLDEEREDKIGIKIEPDNNNNIQDYNNKDKKSNEELEIDWLDFLILFGSNLNDLNDPYEEIDQLKDYEKNF